MLRQVRSAERALELNGRLLARLNAERPVPAQLSDVEFRVYSQFGDDGIIQYLVHRLRIQERTFIEFGVADYFESNTRFLLVNDNWSGFVMDGSERNVRRIQRWRDFWRYDLQAIRAFVTRDNIDRLLLSSGFGSNVGLMHIDLDGNDYWIWEAISVMQPTLMIVEYNSLFGADHAVTIPYRPDFDRRTADFSGLYAGASLTALHDLGLRKGYAFVGCNGAGNNAYFVRRDRLGDISERTVAEGFVESRFRESRDAANRLTFVRGDARYDLIRDLELHDVRSGRICTLRDLSG